MHGFFDLSGQGLSQLGALSLALLLSALVGAERELRQKSAGLRTHALVGVSAALIMLVSKYGFTDVLDPDRVVLDPSRIAAQIVSGIGFIGGGVIFMRRDAVRGLTTAASVWLTAALGMACGAGLPLLALATTGAHFLIMLAFPALQRRFMHPRRHSTDLRITYDDGRGLLRRVLVRCTELRFAIAHVHLDSGAAGDAAEAAQDTADREGIALPVAARRGIVTLRLTVKGKRPVSHLIAALSAIDGVREVGFANEDADWD